MSSIPILPYLTYLTYLTGIRLCCGTVKIPFYTSSRFRAFSLPIKISLYISNKWTTVSLMVRARYTTVTLEVMEFDLAQLKNCFSNDTFQNLVTGFFQYPDSLQW